MAAVRKQLVVLITGCGEGGIGSWYSRAFHELGCKVYASDVRPLHTMEELRQLGIGTIQLDVTSDESAKNAVDNVIAREGRIDVLVNNAGVSLVGPMAELPVDSISKVFQVNVFGTMRMIQQVVPHMAAARSGRIVNVGSVVGIVPTPWAGTYCSSKSSVHALSETLRLELAPLGIQVMLVVPGSVRSQLGIATSSNLKLHKWKLYTDFSDAIAERATASQSERATPTEAFARSVAAAALATPPPPRIHGGYMTSLFTLLAWSPLWARDRFMRWRFGLSRSK